MKKVKSFFRFLALCLNAVNLVILIISLWLNMPAAMIVVITIIDAAISCVNAAYDWSDARKEE